MADVNLTGYQLTFSDEFNSRSISWTGAGTKWQTARDEWRMGDGRSEVGFGISTFVDPTSGYDPFMVEGGALNIQAVPDRTPYGWPGSWESGLITTQGNFSQQYGYFEMRADMSNSPGAWDAFWLLPDNGNPDNDGDWTELDIVEHYGIGTPSTYRWIHTNDAEEHPNPNNTLQVTTNNPEQIIGYHTYGVEWTPETLKFYFDRNFMGERPTPSDYHQSMYIVVNQAVSGNDIGSTRSPLDPLKIDYVRVYSEDPGAVAVSHNPSAPDGNDPGTYGATTAGYDQINLQGTSRRSGSFALESDGDATFTRGAQVDTYRGVEVILFVDGRMVFDADDVVAQVNRLYGAAFLRGADQGGLNAWSSAIGAGTPIASVAQGFLGSAEFGLRYGTNLSTPDFVERLYENALGRPSDAPGKAGWVSAIDSGALTRADTLVGFSESAENRGRTQGAVNAGLWDLSENAAFTARLYDTTLGRLPDVGGLRGWREGLDAGTLTRNDMVSGFVASPEFTTRYGSNPTNSDFVELLYVNALRRASDPGGKAGWVNRIDSGAITPADAVLGFSESAEHTALTNLNIMSDNPAQFGILFAA